MRMGVSVGLYARLGAELAVGLCNSSADAASALLQPCVGQQCRRPASQSSALICVDPHRGFHRGALHLDRVHSSPVGRHHATTNIPNCQVKA